MICAKNYEQLSKFVKVTAKILSVPFFLDTVYIPFCLAWQIVPNIQFWLYFVACDYDCNKEHYCYYYLIVVVVVVSS